MVRSRTQVATTESFGSRESTSALVPSRREVDRLPCAHRYARLDGSTNRVQRMIDISQFQKPDSPLFIYILNTRAGGLGVNLQTADTCILYDSDWCERLAACWRQSTQGRFDSKFHARVWPCLRSNSKHLWELVAPCCRYASV